MRIIISVAVLATIGITTTGAQAQKPLPGKPSHTEEHGWPLDMDGAVRIHNYNGTVTITGWDRDSVSVTAVIAGPAPAGRPSVYGGGGRRGVKMGIDGPDGGTAPAADFVVFVPSRARLSMRGAATAIDIRNFAGVVDASTLSGHLTIGGAVTEITAETMDGDLVIEASPAYLNGKTATGRITWTGASDDVTLGTVSGPIVITSGTLHRARVGSISGDIKFSGTLKLAGRVTFDTHSGDITATLTKETRADLVADAPRGTVLGVEFTRALGKTAYASGIPRGVLASTPRPTDVILRSFKGRVVVTQPQ